MKNPKCRHGITHKSGPHGFPVHSVLRFELIERENDDIWYFGDYHFSPVPPVSAWQAIKDAQPWRDVRVYAQTVSTLPGHDGCLLFEERMR